MSPELLAQQQLLEPPPRRRIIVPTGHGSHWGVDPSTKRLAVAGATLSPVDGSIRRWVRLAPFSGLDGAERLSDIYAQTREMIEQLAACCPWPGIVWVEQPSGAHQEPELLYAVGVTIAAVNDGLAAVCSRRVLVETVPSSTWKKGATGYGAHYKPTRKKLGRTPVFEDYGVARWAQANGYTGSSWDEADAWGIAEAARREVALEQR